MLIRLRSRDGLERLQVADGATVGDLKAQIAANLTIPEADLTLSRDKNLLTTKNPAAFSDLANVRSKLSALGVQNGEMIFMYYPYERSVEPVVKNTPFDARGFGERMTVQDLIAAQTRIERQETPHCASVSFDRHAANVFQSYVHSSLAFSIKRGGLLYGTVDEEGKVKVEAIFEPQQRGSADSLQLERGTEEEQRADYIAEQLGLKKVGWIFAQSAKERDFITSTEELTQMAAMQDEIGQHCVTAVVVLAVSEGGSDVHFEAFQASDQAAQLYKEGWFQSQAEPSGVSTLRNPREPKNEAPVIVAGKDQGDVDNDYFLIPINILDHDGPLATSFPVENRFLPQGKLELRQHLTKTKGKPYVERLSDFHLLLWLSKQPNLDLTGDIALLAQAVLQRAPVPEGYMLIIDSLADL